MTFTSNLLQFRNYIYTDLIGPRLIPMRYIINLFKGFTFLWIIFLMSTFNNYSTGMYLYLFLHGSYGILWLTKDILFPDATFKASSAAISLLILTAFLFGYWLIPLPLAAGYGINQPSTTRIALLISIYLLGLILMLGSDYQKTKTLEIRKGLISNGFFKLTRNPNYLGQILIYSSFVFCSGHIYGMLYVFMLAIPCLFMVNMYLKDKTSYEKKEGWDKYSKQSYLLFPKIFESHLINFAFYSIMIISIGYFLSVQTPQSWLDTKVFQF